MVNGKEHMGSKKEEKAEWKGKDKNRKENERAI